MSKLTGRFSSYTYTVSLLGTVDPGALVGGFSEAPELQKITGMNKSTDITLKRGVVDSSSLWIWLSQVKNAPAASHRTLIVTRHNAANVAIQAWRLRNARPKKYTGPTLGGKGNDVAIEELVLSTEGIELVPPR